MLSSKDSTLIATILKASTAQRQTGAEIGLKAANVRALLAIAALSEDLGYVEVRELVAAGLAAPTRMRAYVAALVEAGLVHRKRRYQRHCLRLTQKGSKVVAECLRATRRAANGFGRE
jgi:DNA-binding MarR family transcriptional regulator